MHSETIEMYGSLALYVGGEWLTGNGRNHERVINPATEDALGALPHATVGDLDAALEAAETGFATWRRVSPHARAEVLVRAAQIIRERQQAIAEILTLEQGKPIREARGEVAVSAEILDWFAAESIRAYGRLIPARESGVRQIVVSEPIGPVLALTPWNFPIFTPASKIAAAIAAGCSCIVKASEETPGSCIELVRALADAGLPPGVLNLVFGVPADVSEHLITSPIIRHVSFTGPIPVGKHLAGLCAKGMKRNTMELGGHAPVIVCGDTDPEKAADILSFKKYRNAGQVCISPSRFFVHETLFARFSQRFTDNAKAIRVGDGLDESTEMGPLAHAKRFAAIEALTKDALSRGAKLATGGSKIGNRGYFFAPTVLLDVPDDARIMQEEPFGPVAPIVPFRDLDDVIKRANALPYGLAAFAFTPSAALSTKLADELEAGMVGINSLDVSFPETPFGGVKESGYGFELGAEGLGDFQIKKFVIQAG